MTPFLFRRFPATWLIAAIGLTGLAVKINAAAPSVAREDRPPRKVVVGTVVIGYDHFQQPLPRRLQVMDEVAARMANDAAKAYPAKPLDLIVLPEFFLAHPAKALADQAVRLDEILPRIAACARLHRAYMIVPALVHEDQPTPRFSNLALIVDRGGALLGIYRKVHPVAPQGTDSIENGTTPGGEFPVFACDFGRLGVQICFDMLYADGWQALAKRGAEIVALPSASPDTAHPSMYALQHGYYVVSATPRDHAAFYSPLGLIEAEATQEGSVIVHQIDLSYEVVHWEEQLEEGAALTKKFGDKVGYHYYHSQDAGIFWSNDPSMTIGQMVRSLGLVGREANVERIRVLEDKARGGPPETLK